LKIQRTRQRLLATTIITGAAMLALSAPALAQTAAEEPGVTVDDVVVTGSRIARQDYKSASPIVTVDAQDFQATGSVTIETLINDLPQFSPSITSTSNNPSNGGQANINLRNLGSNRTLVLLNGHRIVPSNSDGSVDVNLIPTALIKNIEIISGGASAAYGSDALGGVANFILNERFEGVQFDAQYGETEIGDGQTESYALTIGGNFADDKGNLVLSLGRSTRALIYNAARPFSAISGPSGTSPLGSTIFDGINLPSQALVNSYFGGAAVANTGTFGFNDDNSLFAYVGKRNVKNPTGAGVEYTAPGANYTFNTGPLNYGQLPLDRYNAYAAGHYTINENAEVYASALFTEYTADGELAASPAANGTGFRVPSTNPFIPAALKSLLNSRPDPNGSFLLNKRFTSLGGRHSTDEYNIYQLTTGIRGRVPNGDWTYDAYASFGRVSNITTQTGNVSRSAVQTLLDAPDGGVSLCAGGFDPFGVTNLSAECISYIGRSARNQTTSEQRNIEATLQGKVFDLPAGEVRAAFGAQYRQDDFAFAADSTLAKINPTTAHLNPVTGLPDNGNIGGVEIAGFSAQQSLSGGTSSKELYAELLIPLVSNLPFVEQLDLNLGYRFADYSTSGGTSAYRADIDWTIGGGFRARGGYNRSVRAPSIGELYAPANQDFPSIGSATATGTGGDPCDTRSSFRTGPNAAAVKALCLAQGIAPAAIDAYVYSNNQVESVTGGNDQLFEETSDSWTGGLVYTSQFHNPWLAGISASIDYYDITITDAIGAIGAADSLQGCFNVTGENPTFSASNSYCQLFHRDPLSGNIVGAIEQNANLGEIDTSGVDFQADWRFNLADVGAPDWGSLSFNTVISWLNQYKSNVVAGGVFTDRTGTIDSTFGNTFPEWKALTTATWTDGPFTVGARWRRVGELTVYGTTDVLPAIDYFDLNGSWAINDSLSIRGGVNNLTDEQPNVYDPGVQANTDPSTYDILGRRYYVALSAKF
jgi:iron complex outermembrane receptor protein